MQSDPLILAFDTSAAHCAAALLSGDQILEDRTIDMAKGQAEALMPLLQDMLDQHGVGWSDLTAIGVGVGPGNFTGIRISVAAARGLALSLGIKAVGVSQFEAQVWGLARPVVSLVPARRDFVYMQTLHEGSSDLPEFLSQDAANVKIAYLKLPAIGPGHGAPAVPIATGIARLAALRASVTNTRPAPMYIRAADAAPPRDPAPRILDQA